MLSRVCTGRPWQNILIASKEVVGIIVRFDLNETLKVVAVGCSYSFRSFVLHHVTAIAAKRPRDRNRAGRC